MRYFVGCVWFLLGSFMWAQTTASSSLNVRVEPLYPQAALGWNPFLVELENIDSVEVYEGEFLLFNEYSRMYSDSKQVEMSRSFQIAPKTKKRFWIYSDFSSEIGRLSWKIKLKKPNVEEYQEFIQMFPARVTNEYRILVLSKENNVLSHLDRMVSSQHDRYYARRNYHSGYYSSHYGKTNFQIIQAEVDRLPDRKEGYNPIHFVVINNYPIETELTIAQQEALKQWIAEGGEVLLSPGSEQWLKSNWVRDLFPHKGVQVKEKKPETPDDADFSLSKVESFQSNSKDIPFLYFDLDYSERTIFPLVQEEKIFSETAEKTTHDGKRRKGDVYLAHQLYHQGKVHFLPFDISRRPLKDWGERRFYDSFIFSKRTGIFGNLSEINDHAHQLVSQPKNIPFSHLFFLLAFYLLLIGPINYYLLYHFRLQSYLLASVTLISLFCLLLVFIYGYFLNGIQNNYRLMSFTIGDEHYQNEMTYLSVYSAKNEYYTLNTDQKNSTIRLLLSEEQSFPKHPLTYTQEDGKFQLSLPIGLWTTRSFQIQTHHFQERKLPFQIQTVSAEKLEIKPNIPIEEYYVFDSFRLIHYSLNKVDSSSAPISVSLAKSNSGEGSFQEKKLNFLKKNTKEEEDESLKRIYNLSSFIRDSFLSSSSKVFILARLPKTYHQIFLNQESLSSFPNNENYFIQEVVIDD